MRAIDHYLNVEAIIHKQNGLGRVRTTAIAAQLLRIRKSDRGAVVEVNHKHPALDRIGTNIGMRS